jgi:glycosyltransferase involved in cell wall biosynthesis
MKITIASSGLGHVARGVEAWAADLARALVGRGLDVTLCKGGGQAENPYERVLPCWQRTSAQTARLLRWLPRRLFWRLGLNSTYGVEQTTFALGLLRQLRREPADILHVQDPRVALVMQRARRLGLISARTILGNGTEEALSFQRRITFLQQVAPWHLEEAQAAGVARPTWIAIPYFIDTDLFRPGPADALRAELNIPQGALVVLTSAAIKRAHKRVDYLLREFAQLRAQHPELPAYLVVAGGWEPDTPDLLEMGREWLGDHVRFLVNFPRARMPELYRVADLFVLCSLKEMFGIALLEAAATCLPCLVHDHPVLRWVVGPGGQALDLHAPGALTAALAEQLADSASRRGLGDRARAYCVANFSRDRVVDQVLAYYERVISLPERSPAALPEAACAPSPASCAAGR